MSDDQKLLDRFADRRVLVPVLAGVLVGVASTVPASFPTQRLFEVLVLAQASLLAIVVSVSMLSMQVSTNRFAPQLAQLYRESGFNAIIARFGASILLDLALFAVPASAVASPPTRGVVVALSVGAAAWAFVWLLEVEKRLLVFLNPEPVLDTLVDSVSFERYHEFSVTRREDGRVSRNPILEIHQVVQTSLEQRDNYSALQAIDALDEASERLLTEYADLPAQRRRETADSLHKLFEYWNRIADLAVEEGADDTLHAVADAEVAVGRRAIELDVDEAATGAADALYHFCAVSLANNRLEPRYYATLGDLLTASVDADSMTVARRVVTDLARLSRLVARREDDLLVAADDRIAPHEEFFDNWAHFLDAHQSKLDTAECRSLYGHFEDEFRTLHEEAIQDCRSDEFVDQTLPGLRTVGVAAADTDVQWVVSRVTALLVSVAASADSSLGIVRNGLQEVVAAGGREGVEDAARRLQQDRADDQQRDDEWHGRIEDPVAVSGDGQTGGAGTERVPEGLIVDGADRYLEAVESALRD